MIKHNVKQFSEFPNGLDRPLNCFCERCWGVVRHRGAHYHLRNIGICLQELQQSCSFIRIFFSCHLCSKHNFKLETVKNGSFRGGERWRENVESEGEETWVSRGIREDGKLSEENVKGAQHTRKKKLAVSSIWMDGWQQTHTMEERRAQARK